MRRHTVLGTLEPVNERECAMKKILIATDGSESGLAAVATGLELAAEEKADVVFVYVGALVDLGFRVDNGDTPPHRVPRPESQPVLAQALELAVERGVPATAELLMGYAAKQIARLADDLDVDLIVVGTRRLGRMKRAVLGSTSRELLALTKRPVLIAGQNRAPLPA
jgi:nucleotide-binding universal stress UspA family protein